MTESKSLLMRYVGASNDYCKVANGDDSKQGRTRFKCSETTYLSVGTESSYYETVR